MHGHGRRDDRRKARLLRRSRVQDSVIPAHRRGRRALGPARVDNGLHEGSDIAQPVLEYLMNLAIIYFIVHVDNAIPESSHRSVDRQGICRQQPSLTDNLERLYIRRRNPEPPARNDMVTYVNHRLNASLQVVLG